MTTIEPGDAVKWGEAPGKVIGVFVEPSAIVEFDELGMVYQKTIGLSQLEKVQPPVPPLPTEPYTAIEVTWKEGSHNNYRPTKLSLTEKGLWRTLEGQRMEFELAWFGVEVERFEVLAEPRDPVLAEGYEAGFKSGAATALERVVDRLSIDGEEALARLRAIGRELGVER